MITEKRAVEIDFNLNEPSAVKIVDFFNYIKEKGGSFEILTPDGFQKIGDIYNKKNKKIWTLSLQDGKILTGSEDHLVLLDTPKNSDEEINENIEILDGDTWCRLKNIKQTDWVKTINGSSKVSECNFKDIDETYDLEVLTESHSFISNDIISHNTGKSSIADGIALRIIQRKCSRNLYNKRIVMLDLASLVSGTKYRGQFEERLKAVMSELEKQPDVILFLDEIHTIIGAGGASGSLDAANIMKPALARGEIQIIGATTLDEYRKHIEKDGALERRFQKVVVEPSTEEETIQILANLKEKYESHHNVIYSDDAIKACVELTSRYMTDRFLPDKALDALDEAGSRVQISNVEIPKEILDIEEKISEIKDKKTQVVRNQKYEEAAKLRDVEKQLLTNLEEAREKWEEEQRNHKKTVSEDNVAEVVSMMTGIPLQKIGQKENEKLSKMFDSLAGKVIGQDEAVKKVVKAIQRGRVGMKDPGKPLLTSLMLGPSGVGKTELAKQLAKYLFDSEDSLLRLDMSEFMEKISITRISGAAPGYVGFEDATFLDRVRRKPYSVILLDEIEKAHSEVFNLFLQVFDDGHMTDSHGRKVSFKNCVILMTSNVGVRFLKDFGTGVGFATQTKTENKENDMKGVLEKELKKKFAPEFINRLDEIVYFNELTKEDIFKIIDLELAKTLKRAGEIGYNLTVDESLKEYLIQIGYDKEFGARPLKRAIQKWVDDYITEFIIENNPKIGTDLEIIYDSEADLSVVKLKKNKSTKTKNKKEGE
jgi:ATP-dependent Clp protease ATP-binding subunit ClpC